MYFSPSSRGVIRFFFFVRAKKEGPRRRTDATGGETSTREKRDESNASGRVATRSPTVAVVSGAFAPRFDFCLPRGFLPFVHNQKMGHFLDKEKTDHHRL